jgi:hypothetical protein
MVLGLGIGLSASSSAFHHNMPVQDAATPTVKRAFIGEPIACSRYVG